MEEDAFTDKSAQYLREVESSMQGWSPPALASRVMSLVSRHEQWRGRECLNMNPAEGLMSERSLRLLASDMATRVTEGLPGDKEFPHYRQNELIDEIEAMIIALARRQFGARFCEWRPTSTSMANAAVFFALLEQGDTLLAQDLDAGGNYAYQPSGPAGLVTNRVVSIPPSGDTFEIDPAAVDRIAQRVQPKMIVIGGGKVLFPYPLRELRAVADRVGAILVYDAAHVGLLISAGDFQRPLEEGAHVVTVSTHKIMGGPVGGLILSNDSKIAARITRLMFPGFVQTRDQNKLAALAMTLAELESCGAELAQRMVGNAQALAAYLDDAGFTVLGRRGERTATHQVFLKLGAHAANFEWRCQNANILIPDCALSGDVAAGRRSGARLGTHEISRLGMGEPEMRQIANLIRQASLDADGTAAAGLAAEVRALRTRFPNVHYSLDAVELPDPVL
ncbi:MAG: aminotransferase class I/II-fold pyridoxal phosphate-dependent enzyme [Proteobacteria bacterium]|nr:aminotransferase class I/II-fold pyridoxal phosphate-dependent enzyme [Pseudomonadota bacterium]